MLKRLFAFILGRRVVWLSAHSGYERTAVAKLQHNGMYITDFYWPFDIRPCTLAKDGIVRGGVYVERWGYVKPLFNWPWIDNITPFDDH